MNTPKALLTVGLAFAFVAFLWAVLPYTIGGEYRSCVRGLTGVVETPELTCIEAIHGTASRR